MSVPTIDELAVAIKTLGDYRLSILEKSNDPWQDQDAHLVKVTTSLEDIISSMHMRCCLMSVTEPEMEDEE